MARSLPDASSPHTPRTQHLIQFPTPLSRKCWAASPLSSSSSGTESPCFAGRRTTSSGFTPVNSVLRSSGTESSSPIVSYKKAGDKRKTAAKEAAKDGTYNPPGPSPRQKRVKSNVVIPDVRSDEIFEKPLVLRIRRNSKQDLSVNVHGFTFYSYDKMEAWVLRMPEGADRIIVWSDIIAQLSLFFNGASSFAFCVAKTVRADPSFRQCQWSVGDIDTLLHPIEVHVEAAASIRNRCKEALTLISREWGVDAEEYICRQGLVEWSLKLIASVANWRDVPDLKTGLLLANTQAVRQIMERKTFQSRRLFLTPQDWQLCKKNPIPSRDLFDEELHNAGIHLNLAGEICPGRLLLPMPGCTTNTASTTSTPAPTLSTRPAPAPTSSPLPTLSATSYPLPAPAPTTPTPLAPPMLSTPAPTSTPTTSASTSQRSKVASVEDDEESDSELLSRG